jgi:NADH-quinone oxidoreductase subunit N
VSDFVFPNLAPVVPEIILLTMTCVVLLWDVYRGAANRMSTYRLAQFAIGVTLVAVLVTFPAERVVTLSGTFILDPMAALLKAVALIVGYLCFFYARDYLHVRDALKGEYFLLGLFALLGMMVLMSANSLLTVYLGLELLSLSMYALVALNRDSASSAEAAMKYFVLGALASGMLLYGMSMLYGATGSLDLGVIHKVASARGSEDLILVLGVVFVLVGIAFKLGAAPFHMWVPDVYEGAQTPVAMFVGTAPKLAAFAMMIRLLVDGLSGLHADWSEMLIILAILSMAVGNIIAIAQSNIKRMLAYSTIAHMGYLFLGMVSGTVQGYAASMFYIIVYSIMSAGAFGMIIVLSRAGFEADKLDDFKGLSQRSPWCGLLVLILMLSMAGVPPLLGFWAKWAVLQEVINAGYVWLAVVAMLLSVIGLFYYLRIIKLVYFDAPVDETPLEASQDVRMMVSVNSLFILLVGLFPGGLLALCLAAMG